MLFNFAYDNAKVFFSRLLKIIHNNYDTFSIKEEQYNIRTSYAFKKSFIILDRCGSFLWLCIYFQSSLSFCHQRLRP